MMKRPVQFICIPVLSASLAFAVPLPQARHCVDDYSALTEPPTVHRLEGEGLDVLIEGLAHFELNQVQDPTKPPSVKQELMSSVRDRVSVAARRSGLSEAAIRQRILEAKQRLVFSYHPLFHRPNIADALKREQDLLFRPMRYFPEKVLPFKVRSVVLSPDGARVFVRYAGVTGLAMLKIGSDVVPVTLPVSATTALAFSTNGRHFVGGGSDAIQVLDPATGQVIQTLNRQRLGLVSAIAITDDGRAVAAGLSTGTIEVWNTETGDISQELKPWSRYLISGIQIDPEGHRIAGVSSNDVARLWKFERGRMLWNRWIGGGAAYRSERDWKGISAEVLIPGAERLLTAGSDGEIRLRDLSPDGASYVLGAHVGKVRKMVVTPDGKLAMTLGIDDKIYVWDLERKQPPQEIPLPASNLDGMILSAGGDRLAAVDKDLNVHIWTRRPSFAD